MLKQDGDDGMAEPDEKKGRITPEFYYSLLPQEVRDSFSNEQAYAVKILLKKVVRVPSEKILDLETGIWCFKRFYLCLYLGENRRKRKRRFSRNRDLLFSLFLKFIIYLGFVAFLGLIVAGIYFLITLI